MTKNLLYLLLIVFTLYACQYENATNGYTDITEEVTDSLLTDIVTYMHARPSRADQFNRFESQFRDHYVRAAEQYSVLKMEKHLPSGKHYYFISRPARSLQGNRRGVGGYFEKDNNGQITNFREVFVTIPADDEKLTQDYLPSLYQQLKTDTKFSSDTHTNIEWPDGRLYYDTVKFEWRYVD